MLLPTVMRYSPSQEARAGQVHGDQRGFGVGYDGGRRDRAVRRTYTNIVRVFATRMWVA